MDPLIAKFDTAKDGDLRITGRGVSYQADMSQGRVPYNGKYFEHYVGLEDKPIAKAINAGRVAMVNKYVGPETGVLDIGVGSGEFIKNRANTFGYDVNPVAKEMLHKRKRWSSEFAVFDAFTFWDVLEHVENPHSDYFKHMRPETWLFTSLPIFTDLAKVRQSKHYKPGEHLYYFTEQGFIDWMALYRFQLVERSDFESKAGRENILSFAFKRDLPDYHDTLEQYRELHFGAYGISGSMWLDTMAPHVLELNPASILDYGCGRSDLAAHFWNDGKRRIARYDPAIPAFKTMPEGTFDLVICCDVMEHILMADVQRVLDEIKLKSSRVIFTISLIPARAKLPDGRNAHVTLLTAKEWKRWIGSTFGEAQTIGTEKEHLLMLKTF